MVSEVETDIAESKNYKSIGVKMIDGKISASFCRETRSVNCCGEYTNYDKIFDTWKEFGAYADEFFNLES